jgi:hypothetical protein
MPRAKLKPGDIEMVRQEMEACREASREAARWTRIRGGSDVLRGSARLDFKHYNAKANALARVHAFLVAHFEGAP